jgi:hypothetical protein
MLDRWAAPAGGFPAMTGNVPFMMKGCRSFRDLALLLKQDVVRVLEVGTSTSVALSQVSR